MNTRNVLLGLVTFVGVGLGLYTFFGRPAATASPTSSPRLVTNVKYDVAYPARTELCVDRGIVMRNWIFADRWMMNQLTHDTYTVDGRVYNALRIVTNRPNLPSGHVRFRKVVVNIGDGPTLEGHSYLRTLINGSQAKMERELLFVEFNGRLERQRRPLPACGTPRS